jgi:RHS repeat-associated protein
LRNCEGQIWKPGPRALFSYGADWVGVTTPVYDSNGNMKTDQTGNTLFYDAWNRLVRVMSGTTVLELYTYDALGRRVMENPSGTLPKSLYYSSAWQVLEERWSGATQVQYVWSPVYVDAMIERDRGSERFYVQQDANWNVTAIVNATTGAVQERYVYDPYGQPTVLDGTSWNTLSASGFAWVYLHQGGRYDTATGLYSFRNRDYSPSLGRWMQLDPIGFTAGDVDLYRYVGGDPVNAADFSGLAIYVIQGANNPAILFTRIPNPVNQAFPYGELIQPNANCSGPRHLRT